MSSSSGGKYSFSRILFFFQVQILSLATDTDSDLSFEATGLLCFQENVCQIPKIDNHSMSVVSSGITKNISWEKEEANSS